MCHDVSKIYSIQNETVSRLSTNLEHLLLYIDDLPSNIGVLVSFHLCQHHFWTPFPGGTPIPVTILWLGRMRIRRGELGQPTIVRSLNLLLSMVNDVTCTFTSSFFFARYLRFTMVSGWWCLTLHDFTLFGCASIMRYQWAHCSFKIGPEAIQSGGQDP